MAVKKMIVGDRLPHFILNDENHIPVDISNFHGKYLILFFYPKDETPGCIKEACSFRDSYQYLEEAGAVVFGVSSDNPDSHQQFKAKHKLPFHLLSDTGNELRHLLGVPSDLFGLLPGRVTYIFNPEGQLLHMFKSQLASEKHVQEALKVIHAANERIVPNSQS